MDIKEYIASGILENYVLGLLSLQQSKEVEANLIQYPELRQELDSIERALETYAQSQKVMAPPGLEALILNRINQEGPNKDPSNDGKDSSPDKKSGTNLSDYLLGFLAIAVTVIAGWSIIQYQNQSQDLKSLQSEQERLQTNCAEKDNTIQSLRQQLFILRDNNNLRVPMKGTDKAPTAIANVLYNSDTQKSYLDVLRLPPPPSDKQYQLWAIVDGTPVDMGVFEVILTGNTLQEIPFVENPQAFAVTLEKRGGSPTPTLEEMVVIGNFVST